MITLKTFGAVDLRGDDNRSLQAILAQPKRLALVVYLAVATPRGYHRRDQLLGLLWPELDETRARRALNRALHFVRAAMGEDVLPSRGPEELGLEWTRISSDVAGFEDAIDRGELAEALALYRGPLLPGFFVDEAPAYDNWLEGERRRLRQRALEAAGRLSEQELKAGRVVAAVEWARRATALAPQDETTLRRLMTLLEQAGDRAGAIRSYEDFARELSRELGVQPSAETSALCAAIRARATAVPATTSPLVQAMAPSGAIVVVVPQPVAPAPERALDATARRVALGGAALAAAVLLLWAAKGYTSRRAAAAAREMPVAIVPFTTSGRFATAQMADSLREDLERRLDSLTTVRVVSSTTRARDGFVIAGSVASIGRKITVTARVLDSIGSPSQIAVASVEGVPGETTRLARDLVGQLTEIANRGKSGFSDWVGEEKVRSVEAYEALTLGDVANRAGRFAEAAGHFRRAAEIDTAYGLAYYRLSMAASWENEWGLTRWGSDMAMQHLSSFSALDQIRVRAWDAYIGARPREAESLARFALANKPDDGEWTVLGEVQFHWGPLFGWPRDDARRSFAMLDTLGEIGNSLGSVIHLARIAAVDGERARVDSLVAFALRRKPDASQTLELRALRAFGGTAATDQNAIVADIARASDGDALNLVTLIAVCGMHNTESERAVEALVNSNRNPGIRALAAVLSELFENAHGRSDGGAQLRAIRAVPAERVLEREAVVAGLPFVAVSHDSVVTLRGRLMRATGDARADASLYGMMTALLPMRQRYLLGRLSLRLGDLPAAERYADTLASPPFLTAAQQRFRMAMARVLRAQILRAKGRPTDALEALGEPDYPVDAMLPGLLYYPAADERFLRAELLYDLHRDDEARRWYDTFPDPAGYDLPYVAPSLLRRAAIAERQGDTATANALRSRAQSLWINASREFAMP